MTSRLILLLLAFCVGAFAALHRPHKTLLETTTKGGARASHLWRFNSACSNSVRDWADGKGPAAVLSNAAWVTDPQAGTVVSLKGTQDSLVNLGNSVGQFGTAPFTIAWSLKTSHKNRLFDVLGNRVEGSHGNFIAVRMTAAGVVTVELDQDSWGANYVGLSSGAGYNDGQWHHYVVTRDGTTVTLYIDGANAVSGKSAGVTNLANNKPFKLGPSYLWESTFYIAGSFERFATFDYALSACEIKDFLSDSQKELLVS